MKKWRLSTTVSKFLGNDTHMTIVTIEDCDSPNRPTYGVLLNLFTYLLTYFRTPIGNPYVLSICTTYDDFE